MNNRTKHLATLVGMAAGPEAALAILEDSTNDVLGKSKGTLELPRPWTPKDKAITEAWGFEWPEGEEYDPNRRGRPMTVKAKVPEGWSVVATDHGMYKNLLDPKGQVRASLMMHYIESDAWLTATPKYRATIWQANFNDDEAIWPVIEDSNNKVLWVGNKIEARPNHYQERRDYWKNFRENGDGDQEAAERNEPQNPTDQARKSAEAVLLVDLGINPSDQKWFDTPFEFPPSVGTLPDVKDYRITTNYYQSAGGSYADGGTETLRAASDSEAKELAQSKIERSSRGYHKTATLHDPEGKKIWEHEDPRPVRRPARFGGRHHLGYFDCDDGYGRSRYDS